MGLAGMRNFSAPMTFLLLLCFSIVLSDAEYLKYEDPKQPVGARIKDLMGRMTLEVSYMTQVERKLASPDFLKKYFTGSVLRCMWECVAAPKVSVQQWVNMVNELRKGLDVL